METYTHKQIYELLRTATRPVFVSDERIDGDSLGSALAMVDFMMRFGARPQVYVAEVVPEQYQSLPHIDVCTTDILIFQNADIDLVVVFDCSDANFVAKLLEEIPSHPIVINIDHHKTNSGYGHVNQVIVGAPATAEIVYRFFEVNNVLPSKDSATCLLTGMCFDTSAFTNSATNERVLDSASELILLGARVQDVIHTMFHNRSLGALRVWGAALERLSVHNDPKIVSTCLTRKDIEENGVNDDEIDGLSNFLNLVADTDILIVLRETKEGGVKASMRSRSFDVSSHAKLFGGGGHAKAAGFTIPNAKFICDDDIHWKLIIDGICSEIHESLRFGNFLKS